MTTKLHLAITPDYSVVEGQLSGGNIADITIADALIAEVFGCYVVEDMGYDSDHHRAMLQANNNIPVIRGAGTEKFPSITTKNFMPCAGALSCSLAESRKTGAWPSATRKPTYASLALSPVPSLRPSTFINSA